MAGDADAADPTELAGVAEADTELGEAWSAAEDYPETGSWADPERRLTPRRVTVLAVVASVVIVGAAVGAIVWQLRKERPVSTLHVVVATQTTTTVVTEPVAPPPMTVTVQPPPPRSMLPPVTQFSALDRALISKMIDDGWHITNAEVMVTNAHVVCGLLHNGASPESVDRRVANDAALTMDAATRFVSTAMLTYPNCP